MKGMLGKGLSAAAALCCGLALAFGAQAAEPPPPGKSERVDAIRKAGVLKVGVIANPPWLIENTGGSGGEPWSGPAWMLARKYAELLGVELQTVPVSNETKVPVLAANQVDISIAPLAESQERLKVVDFVLYSNTSVCMFGLASNPRFKGAKSVDDLNSPEFTIGYLVGAVEETWVKERFPKANLRGVINAATVPVDEVMARRVDAAPVNRVQWVALSRQVKGLGALPRENNCQDSTEKAQPVGMAVHKGQDAFLDWLRRTAEEMKPAVQAEEQRIIAEKL